MKKFFSSFLLLVCVGACLLAAPARTVTLVWEHSPTPAAEVSGYNLYVNTDPLALPGMTAPTLSVGYVTLATFILPAGPGPFYATARTRGINNIESDDSNNVIVKIPAPPAALRFAP